MPKVGPEYLNCKSKRRFDVLGAIAAGLVLVPGAAVGYTAAAIDNKSLKPFYTDERVGMEGKKFPVTKLRTLRPELVKSVWSGEGAYDPRASGIGGLLRRFCLDEIPQLKNVIEGNASLLGIRIATDPSLDHYRQIVSRNTFDEWFEAYNLAKPGLAGPSQIYRHKFKNPGDKEYAESILMDIDYVKRASLINDVRILGGVPLKLLAANIFPVEVSPAAPELPVAATP
jgi:lipopolysaccharide/colanic/teichoic acid biosynthesis glycosyltransferase